MRLTPLPCAACRCRSTCATAGRGITTRRGDDVGLRVLVGRKQAVVSTNDVNGEGLDTLGRARRRHARAAPEDRFAGLADPSLLARQFPELDLLDPDLASVEVLEKRAREAEEAALAVTGVTKSGGASASSASAAWCS